MEDQDNAHTGVHLHAGGNQSISNSEIVGRDKHTYNDNRKRNIRLGLGGLALLLVVGGGATVYFSLPKSPSDVVSEKGLSGAQHTVERLKQAEIDQDAASWCLLASPKDSASCHAVMTASFGQPSPLRAELADVGVGSPTGGGNSASVPITLKGKNIGVAPMQWDGKRWEINPAAYLLMMNNGGLAMSAVEAEHGCGALLGAQSGCKR
ncbi:hypothetical protein [Actinocrispum wychmicini]|uniref:Uncharacterized protein n=1 Tax=Actinocrispum wychmicini TaxID=1213861 RepID=A0A4R2JE86_9PSEU|nr:hypothetical protein [Actinocrispum wychmicini]TCO57953.1 hypothetical protein EV192_10515 [Actinocrispum wychmicini]